MAGQVTYGARRPSDVADAAVAGPPRAVVEDMRRRIRFRTRPVENVDRMTPPPTSDDDARLVRAIASGDEAALARAYDVHGSLVYGLALRIVRSPPDAEEVLQDVFATLWRTASRFDAALGTLPAYLTTLTRHRAIDRVRRRSARPDVAVGSGDDADATPLPASGPGPSDVAASRDEARRAVAALGTLAAVERRVLEMAYFDGLSQSEIAARTGDALGTVKGRTRNALRRLREALPRPLGGAS
jgi:RNA polymerase sigma-70 factor (ECF subfamily)